MKINWDYIKFTLLAGLAVFLFSFSSERNHSRNLQGKEVIFLDDENHFITLETVNKLLIQNNEDVTSLPKETLDLHKIENTLNSNPMIHKAEVFLTVDGILGARIKQRKPIARVSAWDSSYYLDEEGKEMPLSKVHTARVPLITGGNKEDYEGLKELLLKIRQDTFMNSHVVGIHVEDNRDLTLLLRIYDFKIHFGKPENINQKFQNFKAFYQKTTKDNTLSSYNLINLKLDSQVVGTKI